MRAQSASLNYTIIHRKLITIHTADRHKLPSVRISRQSKKPSYIGRKIYNSLPLDLNNLTGRQLKNQLKDWLVQRPFYTLNEYFDVVKNSNKTL
ncbi:hypothetical protein J6590_017412 [Homalodisca vitripennis]|nr:hypothetical protein J6590_017412 [Homalodisca vitripennis]